MKFDVVRAWKDENYRQSLSEEQRRLLPANPAGEAELADADLQAVYGGWAGPAGVGAAAGAASLDNGGFGFNNFNRLLISRSCSHNCSFGCDIHQDFD
jgi:mersacidin/lichenicidin family type 2 lantibiotic